MKKTHVSVTAASSAIDRYRSVIVGNLSTGYLIRYEGSMLLSAIPGAAGIFLRSRIWPRLFGSCGKGCLFGSHVILRHPHRIHIGDRVVVSDGCILDARNDETDEVMVIGNDVMLSNDVGIHCKGGKVWIGDSTGINVQTVIQSVDGNPVRIGRDVIIGPRCYIVGGGSYRMDRLDLPMRLQGIRPDGGLVIEDDVWLGANVTVMGGVVVHTGSVVAAHAVVTHSVPQRAICMGIPARVVQIRGQGDAVHNT
ncbi:acyltransferase [Desulfatirhabdium butyrativorans]|uniref:acyltransferase n=1 Tax=Desulfatirhabdium butyrativorans TaxID=340467 RepID=UPI00040454F2|nr:acyltransferase [Desulfatirhabdium butyrativorans]